MRTIYVLATLAIATTSGIAQKYTVADFADFTKSPTEHVLKVVEQPFTVRSIRGVIEFRNGSLEPLKNVLLEIQGPATDKRLRQTTSDEHGRFKMSHVPIGTYKFKATLTGYQSSVGTIIVSKNANETSTIRIEMLIGN
jgi:Carboxypeptidase regulatory-like domain